MCMHASVCMCVHAYVYACVCVCKYSCMHVWVFTYTCVARTDLCAIGDEGVARAAVTTHFFISFL